MRTKAELIQMQSLPLEIKVAKTKLRIREWVDFYGENGVYVSFSGGKDSTVLLHIVREMYPNIEAVFIDTGLEYPEIKKFVKTFDNVTIIRPKMRFDEVIKKYGYPLISKEVSQSIKEVRSNPQGRTATKFDENSEYCKKYGARFSKAKWSPLKDSNIPISDLCCGVMKKTPAKKFEKDTGKKPIVATMAEESALRETQWVINGCNVFEGKRQRSAPMSFWTEQDVLQYIAENKIEIASVYGDITTDKEDGQMCIEGCEGKYRTTKCNRTGCIFCAFGAHLEKEPTRFQRLKETHPKQYQYCIGGGEFNEEGIWQPNKEGLGMGYVFDQLNAIYGEGFIKYK
jgi:3'-phosphoadenosine 5'-phosphosulfate sulfotransferase (PAPS reductase)/FAD synthetase